MATTSPVAERYPHLDILRGFAVMGILLINIVAFSMPDMAAISPAVYGPGSQADIITWATTFILFDGKMRGLFSLLFGASLMLIVERAAVNEQSPAEVHYARMFWLAIFGLAHFFFLWWGDILFLYAGAGAIVFFFRNWEARRLIKWGAITYIALSLLFSVGLGTLLFLQIGATAPGADAALVAEYAKAVHSIGVSPEAIAEQLAVYQGSYSDILADKFANRWSIPLQNLILAPLETIPLMMIGMGLYKNGFLLGNWDGTAYRRIAGWFVGIGAVLFALLAWTAYAADFEIAWVMNITQGWAAPARLLMTIGYAALLVIVATRFAGNGLVDRVAAAGRAAFTNYLGTSLVCTFIFYGYGLGWFGEVARPSLYLVVLGVWALMLLWSKPWLDRFRFGPLEWLWRSLARREIQPMRR